MMFEWVKRLATTSGEKSVADTKTPFQPLVQRLAVTSDFDAWSKLSKIAGPAGQRFRTTDVRSLEIELLAALDGCSEEGSLLFFQLLQTVAFLPSVEVLLSNLESMPEWKRTKASLTLRNLATYRWECPRCGSGASASGASVTYWQCEECGLRKTSLGAPNWGQEQLRTAMALVPEHGRLLEDPRFAAAWSAFLNTLNNGDWRSDIPESQKWTAPALPVDVEMILARKGIKLQR